MASETPFTILLVEDNPADAHLFMSMLKELGMRLNVIVAGDGQRALSILTDCIASSSAPNLVILDLNLPKVHGYEVLSFLKSSPLRSVPVVVMTGSLNTEDEARALSMGAAMYIIKPCTLEEYDNIVARLKSEIVPREYGRKGDDRASNANLLGTRPASCPGTGAPALALPIAPWPALGDRR